MSLVAHVATGCIKTNRATRVEGKRMMMAILTPVQVEQRLVALSKEIDNAHHDLVGSARGFERFLNDVVGLVECEVAQNSLQKK